MKKITILGAGLAGLALADALLEAGLSGSDLLILDTAAPGKGGSGVPYALMHPVPGRSLALKPEYLACFLASQKWLAKQQKKMLTPCVKTLPLLRVAVDENTALRFEKSFQRNLSPHSIPEITPLSPPPWLSPPKALYQIQPSFQIQTAPFLTGLVKSLTSQGVQFQFPCPQPQLDWEDGYWRIRMEQERIDSAKVVLAASDGSLAYLPPWPLDRVRGETIILEHPSFAEIQVNISARGHLTPLGQAQILAGATFYPASQPFNSAQSIAAIKCKMAEILPWAQEAKVLELWSGIRTIQQPQREPLVGALEKGLYLMTAFASKGFLQIPLCAQALAKEILGLPFTLPACFSVQGLTQKS